MSRYQPPKKDEGRLGSTSRPSSFSVFDFPTEVRMFPPYELAEDKKTKIYPVGAIKFSVIPFEITSKNHSLVLTKSATLGEWAVYTRYKRHNLGEPWNATFVDPDFLGLPCPLEEEQKAMVMAAGKWADMSKDQQTHAKKLFPQERHVFWLKVEGGQYNGEIFLYDTAFWDKGKGIPFTTALNQAAEKYKVDNELQDVDYADPEKGVSISAYISMDEYMGNKYPSVDQISFVPRKKSVTDEDLAKVFDPSAYYIIKSYEEIKAIYELDTETEENNQEEKEVSMDEALDKGVAQAAKTTKPTGMECPSGGEFGQDFRTLDECGACDLYSQCKTESMKL